MLFYSTSLILNKIIHIILSILESYDIFFSTYYHIVAVRVPIVAVVMSLNDQNHLIITNCILIYLWKFFTKLDDLNVSKNILWN